MGHWVFDRHTPHPRLEALGYNVWWIGVVFAAVFLLLIFGDMLLH